METVALSTESHLPEFYAAHYVAFNGAILIYLFYPAET